MSNANVIPQLVNHPFLRGFSDSQIKLIADCAKERNYQKGDYLFRYQKLAEEFLLTTQGTVLLLNNIPGQGITPLETIAAPSVVGWSWLQVPYRWHFDARAQTPVNGLAVDANRLRQTMQSDVVFGYEMYRRFFEVVVDRLQASRLQALDVYAKPITSYI